MGGPTILWPYYSPGGRIELFPTILMGNYNGAAGWPRVEVDGKCRGPLQLYRGGAGALCMGPSGACRGPLQLYRGGEGALFMHGHVTYRIWVGGPYNNMKGGPARALLV